MSKVALNAGQFANRLHLVYDAWNDSHDGGGCSTSADVDARLLVAGDPAGEHEPVRRGITLQRWLLGFEFPQTFLLFERDRLSILTSASEVNILSQLKDSDTPVPIEFFVQARVKQPPTDAVPRFLEACTSFARVATFIGERQSGRLVEQCNEAVAYAEKRPVLVDMTPFVASFLTVNSKDEE